jgi:hypothetical protein
MAVGILLIAAILLAVQAQALFSVEHLADRDAGIPYALAAMIAFAAVAYLADRWLGKAHDMTDCPTAPHKTNAPTRVDVVAEIRSGVKRHPWRTAGVVISITLWFITLGNLRIDSPLPDYTLTLIMWLVSMVLVAVSVVIPRPRPRRDWKAWWQRNWPFVVAVGAIGLAALVLRVFNLDQIPPTLGGDEGSQGVEALKILRGQLLNPSPPVDERTDDEFLFNTLTIGSLGNGLCAAPAMGAHWHGDRVDRVRPDATAGDWDGPDGRALLAAYHFHIHYSRLARPGTMRSSWRGFFFLYRAYDEGGMLNCDGRHGGRAGSVLLCRSALRHDHGGRHAGLFHRARGVGIRAHPLARTDRPGDCLHHFRRADAAICPSLSGRV